MIAALVTVAACRALPDRWRERSLLAASLLIYLIDKEQARYTAVWL